MPLYLVRWPMFAASLVSAADEDDLLDRLDEQADSEGCVWEEYDGDVYLDFNLPVTVRDREENHDAPFDPRQVDIEADEALLGERLEVEIPVADTAAEMVERMLDFAFPHVAEVFESVDEPQLEDFESALRDELLRAAQASWRRHARNRSTDPDAQIANELGAPVRLVRYWRETAEQQQAGSGPDPDDHGYDRQTELDDDLDVGRRSSRVGPPPANGFVSLLDATGWLLRYVDDEHTMYVDEPIISWGSHPEQPNAEALVVDPDEGLAPAPASITFESTPFAPYWIFHDPQRWAELVSTPHGPPDWPRFLRGEQADRDVPEDYLQKRS